MKRFFSLLLTVAMLLAMIPAVIVGASAEGTVVTTPTVTAWADYAFPTNKHIAYAVTQSGTTVYNSAGESKNWAGYSFNNINDGWSINVVSSYTDSSSVVQEVSNTTQIISAFTVPTTLSEIVVRSRMYMSRIWDVSIYLSTDGSTWTEVVKMVNENGVLNNNSKANAVSYTIAEEYQSTKWTHVKVEKTGNGWVELNGIFCLTNDTANAVQNSTLIGATYVAGYNDNATANIWSGHNVATVDAKSSVTADGYWSYAKLDAPTVLDRIVLTTGASGNRARGCSIYATNTPEDSTSWVLIGNMAASMADFSDYTVTCTNNQAFEYIKIQRANWQYNTSLLNVYVYGYAETATRLNTTYQPELSSTAAENITNGVNVWSNSNTSTPAGSDTDGIVESTVAKFDYPVHITNIYLTSTTAGRNRSIKYEASIDGVNWETLRSSGHLNDNVYSNTNKLVAVNSTKAYLYVRATNTLVKDANNDYHWNVLKLAVYGTPSGCQVTDTQQKIAQDGLTYAVRFVSKVDSLTDYSAVGYKITATAEGMTTKTWKESSTTVYSSIKALVGGVETPVEAGEGKYYFTATVENISIEKYADVTFVIEAFVVVDGVEMYSAPVTVVFNDGVRV